MERSVIRRWVAGGVLLPGLLLMPRVGAAQQTSASDSSSQPAPADAAKKKSPEKQAKPAAPENSFPEEQSKKAAQKPDDQKPAAEEPPSAPDAPASAQAPAAKPGATAADNPFPEDVSEGAAKAAAGNANAGTSSSGSSTAGGDNTGSSSSSSSSGAGDAGADPDAAPEGDVPAHEGRRRLRKPKSSDVQSGSLAGEGRATDDVRVGSYYLTTHNYQGAHMRFEEATKLDPANVEAIYGLAASADGLHKKDEAVENYRLYLQVAPDGERAKAAEKALKSLAH